MKRYYLSLIIASLSIFHLIPCSIADHAYQTDWSGGPGVPGPVGQFGASYYQGLNLLYSSTGTLRLSMESYLISDSLTTYDVYSADIDGDEDIDILAGCFNRVVWWENGDGSGTDWTEHFIATFTRPYTVIAYDVDNDMDIDVIAYSSSGSDDIYWWENLDGQGTEWMEHDISRYRTCQSIHADDFNGDGYVDVVTDYGRWYENPRGESRGWLGHEIPVSLGAVHSGDFNSDGSTDVVFGHYTLLCLMNVNGGGTAWSPCTLAAFGSVNIESLYAEDLDGDGDCDVVTADYGDETIDWFENLDELGTSWTKHSVLEDIDWPYAVSVSDINLDGHQDIVCCSRRYDKIIWLENVDGSATDWNCHEVAGGFDFPYSVCSGDLDGDGYPELIGASPATWWSVSSHDSSGSVTSSIVYLGGDPQWAYLDWTSISPLGTSIGLQVRASDDYGSMGEWSDMLFVPGSLSGILEDYDSYVQYRATLTTDDRAVTPVLDEVFLFWDPLGLESGSQDGFLALLPVSPNPSLGSPSLGILVQEDANVDISVYDVSGRLVFQLSDEEYHSGYHQVQLPLMNDGLYFCRVTSEGNVVTGKFNVFN